jgi:hypothetical protein
MMNVCCAAAGSALSVSIRGNQSTRTMGRTSLRGKTIATVKETSYFSSNFLPASRLS